MNKICLVYDNTQEQNIFHLLCRNVAFVYMVLQSLKDDAYDVYACVPYQKGNEDMWHVQMLKAIGAHVIFDVDQLDRKPERTLEITHQVPWMMHHSVFINYQPKPEWLQFQQRVRRYFVQPAQSTSQEQEQLAVLVVRTKNRVLYDTSDTGALFQDIFADNMQRYKVPYKVVNPDTMTAAEQATVLANAKVLIAAHGAALTNLFLTPDSCHVVEVTFRKHWYCDPLCEGHASGDLPRSTPCGGPLMFSQTYHKADYHNLSKFFGRTYHEIPAETFDGPVTAANRNPIETPRIFVDSKRIISTVHRAMRMDKDIL